MDQTSDNIVIPHLDYPPPVRPRERGHPRATGMRSGPGFTEFYARWLRERGLEHGPRARLLFVTSNPDLFGRLVEVALRGYQRWLSRSRRPDSYQAFADYVQPRYRLRFNAAGFPGNSSTPPELRPRHRKEGGSRSLSEVDSPIH